MMRKSPWVILGRKINVALVGYGHIAKSHLQAIQKHSSSLELVAICDSNKENGEKISSELGVNFYTDMNELIRLEESIDLVVLCTPSSLHAPQTILAAKAGCHVLTEKPIAIQWKDGLEMVKVCEESGVRLFEVKQNRLMLPMRHLKRAIEQGRFGRIYMVNSNVFWTRPHEYYNQNSWRGTWAFDGGIFMNQASHYVDLLKWLVGPIESVTANMATLSRYIETEDTGVLNLRWRSGALGSMSVTVLTYPKNYEASLTILGEKGTVKIGGVAVNKVETWDFSDQMIDDEVVANQIFPASIGHALFYENLICSLQGESVDIVDGRDALSSLEILTAAYRSARDKVTINLPLEL